MTAAEPLVSIVTPTRDQAAFIEETIGSVKAQTYGRIEHIIIDGGSTDGTLDLLRDHQDSYDLRWDSRPDRGMYQAINRGLELARGDILCYLNSDDLYFPWSVEVAVEAIRSGADLVYGDALLLDDASGSLRPHFQPPVRRRYLLNVGSFAQPATWWTRDLQERVGRFDEALRSVGDLDFFIRAAAHGHIVKVDEFLALMRIHGQMQTVAQAERVRAENAAVRLRHGGSKPGAGAVAVARLVAWFDRRAAWLRFLRARRSGRRRGWQRFIRSGVSINTARIALGQVPTLGPRVLPGSVRSEVDWRAASRRAATMARQEAVPRSAG